MSWAASLPVMVGSTMDAAAAAKWCMGDFLRELGWQEMIPEKISDKNCLQDFWTKFVRQVCTLSPTLSTG
jgi:hypothetical protein